MTCPVCGEDTTVSYTHKDFEGVYRRRKCNVCKHIFYTTELESGSDDFNRLEKIAKERSKERQKSRRKCSLRETVNSLERNRSRSED